MHSSRRPLPRIFALLVSTLLILAVFASMPAAAGKDDKDEDGVMPGDEEARGGKKNRPPPGVLCPRNAETRGHGTIVLTFDDSYRSHLPASQKLEMSGMCATFYVVSGQLRADGYYTAYLSAQEVAQMSAHGHDIESHTVTHTDLTTLSASAVDQELTQSQATLRQITGKTPMHLAYPYAAHNSAVRTATAAVYSTGRLYYNALSEITTSPSGAYIMPGLGVEQATSLAQAKSYVDWAQANDRTLLLIFHDIDGTGAYAWPRSDFDALVSYIAQSGVDVRTLAQVGAAGGLPP